ncbi:MAG: CarD family transcriptional regulator [Lachnospiraceae bacterium]|nr:CarD family transcriptional regulator [Lachnospiraceae bacterium]
MFEKGDYVIYGSTGICCVEGVTTINIAGIPKDRIYYILRPESRTESKIFIPVDNQKKIIRKVISKREAEELIEEIPEIDPMDIANDKLREEKYKECIQSCDCRELIRIIKTIYLRDKKRMEQGKKATAVDERYLRLAEENLYTELSMLLGIPKNNMESYITSRIRQKETIGKKFMYCK